MAVDTYTVLHGTIAEEIVPDKRCGRNINHDSRSLQYPWQRSARARVDVVHDRKIPILNQRNTGSCTGNAEIGALGTEPLYSSLPRGTKLNEVAAQGLYSAAEELDGDGPFPPNDNGSSGLSVCRAAKNAKLIAGYLHCLSLAAVLDALQTRPVIIGLNWYDSMDVPDSTGLVVISPNAYVRGAHEILLRKDNVEGQLVGGDNSWGTAWGEHGSFSMGYDTLDRLLHERGDGTVSVQLGQPAPVPVPVPVPPTPVPPEPVPLQDPTDAAYVTALGTWPDSHHVGKNAAVAKATRIWMREKGYHS